MYLKGSQNSEEEKREDEKIQETKSKNNVPVSRKLKKNKK